MQAVNVIKEAKFPPRIGRETTLLDDFLRLVADRPDAVGLVSYFAGRGEPVALTYRQMGELVDKLALRLLELGIGAREFVSCQFPNRWEFAIAHLATIRLGAIPSRSEARRVGKECVSTGRSRGAPIASKNKHRNNKYTKIAN